MELEIDYLAIFSIAVITVGITQLLKTLIPPCAKGTQAAWASTITGIVTASIYLFVPQIWHNFCTMACGVAAATLFYDLFYQSFSKMIKSRLNIDDTSTKETVTDDR